MSLSDYAALYKKTEAIYESKYITPKPGIYICRVKRAEYKLISKETKDYDKFSWDLEILEGDLTGQCFQKSEFLPPPEKAETQIGFIKGAINRCGIFPPADILDLPLAMPKCIGAELEVSVTDTGKKTQEGKCILNIKFTKQIKPANSDPNADNFIENKPLDNGYPF